MSHIKTARDIGVQKAIKEAGYASLEDVYCGNYVEVLC